MNSAIEWLKDRAREPSSWIGAFTVAMSALGVAVSPEVAGNVALIVTGLAGLIAIAMPDGRQ